MRRAKGKKEGRNVRVLDALRKRHARNPSRLNGTGCGSMRNIDQSK
jgi:hypothetical protein